MKYFLISLFILALGFFGVLEPVRGMVQQVATPVQLGFRDMATSFTSACAFFRKLALLHKENQQLTQANLEMKGKLASYKVLEEENELLREQLNHADLALGGGKLLLANVMGNPGDLANSTILIDKGFRHGVSQSDVVILHNFLVGKVAEVYQERSLVELITSPTMSVTGYDVDSPDNTHGVIVGEYGISLIMDRILQEEQIREGDFVLTSGKDGTFIPNLVIGTVKEVNQIPTEPLVQARIEPVPEFSELSRVFVILTR